MRVLVCGGRDYSDKHHVFFALNRLHNERPVKVIIHGCASGADRLAGEWAAWWGLSEMRFYPEWGKHGRAAGPIRNREMLDEGKPDLVVAFPGGKGTANMVKQARERGVRVIEPEPLPAPPARQG